MRIAHHSTQYRVPVSVEDIRLHHYIIWQTLKIFQLKHKTRILIFRFRMNFRLVADAGNTDKIQVFHPFAFNVWHEIIELVKGNRRRE